MSAYCHEMAKRKRLYNQLIEEKGNIQVLTLSSLKMDPLAELL